MRLTVLIACHNRKALTVQSVVGAQAAANDAQVDASFYVYDDGSVDGTSTALLDLDVSVRVIHGDGTAFWARSMATAEAMVLEAIGDADDDYIVWLNDDVVLDPTAFSVLRRTMEISPGAVVVGSMRDPLSGAVSYSGMKRRGLHPLSFSIAAESTRSQTVDTFNGNLVIVPIRVARVLGGIDGGFSHALADIDYGLRCGRLGIPVVLAPGTQGSCARNPSSKRTTAGADWRKFIGAKGGGNYASMKRILRKSNRRSWPIPILVTYGLWWARRIGSTRVPWKRSL